MSNWADGLAALTASGTAVIVSVCSAFLVRRRLTALERRLDRHGSALHSLEGAHSDLITRSLRLPKLQRSGTAPKRSSPSKGTGQDSSAAPEEPDGKNSKEPVLHIVAPKTSPE
jgi:hypothetical protein